MAQLDRSFVLVRFSFGEANVKGRQRNEDTYRYSVKRLAISYADGKYEEIRDSLTTQLVNDVQRELVNLASLYRRFIVGANGNTSTPAGVIRSVIGGATPLTLATVLPSWAPRSADYLRRKEYNRAGTGWFDNRKWSGRGAPKDAGLLFEKSRADVWEQMFGPIKVSFTKNSQPVEARAVMDLGVGDHVKVQLGTLKVRALGNITPDMLPGLAGGFVGVASDSGNPGLAGLVKNYDERLWGRLFQTSSKTHRYRPTLEPFLGYFLTRSIPAAVDRRLREGTLRNITRSSA